MFSSNDCHQPYRATANYNITSLSVRQASFVIHSCIFSTEITGGKNISQQQSFFITQIVAQWNQCTISHRHTDIFCLCTVQAMAVFDPAKKISLYTPASQTNQAVITFTT